MSYCYPPYLAETPGLSKCLHQPGSSCRCSAEVRQRDALLSADVLAGQRDVKTQDVYLSRTPKGTIIDVFGSRGARGQDTNVQGTTQSFPTYNQNQSYYYPQVCPWCVT